MFSCCLKGHFSFISQLMWWVDFVTVLQTTPDLTFYPHTVNMWQEGSNVILQVTRNGEEVTVCITYVRKIWGHANTCHVSHTYVHMWQVTGGSDAMYNTCRQWQEEMVWCKEHAVCDRKWRQVQCGMQCALTLTRSAQPMNSSVSLFQCRWQGEILGLGLQREKGQWKV